MNEQWQYWFHNTKRSEIVLAYYLAPFILREKPASLFAFRQQEVTQVWELKEPLGFHVMELGTDGPRSCLFLYWEDYLTELLLKAPVQAYLAKKGYRMPKKGRVIDQNEILQDVRARFQMYLQNKGERDRFPHEIGVLLGYPIYDVMAYEKMQGRDALLNGYWKVYHNIDGAAACFKRYDIARHELLAYVQNHSLASVNQRENGCLK